MNLVYDLLNESFELTLGEFNNIIIENVLEYRRVVKFLGSDKVIYITNNDGIVRNFNIINSVLFLDYNDRKIISKILKDLTVESKNEDNMTFSSEINMRVYNYLQKIIFDSQYPVSIDFDPDFSTLLKAFGLKVKLDEDSLIEEFIDYLDLFVEVFGVEIFYTLNITQYLTVEELESLSKCIKNKKLLLINFDRTYLECKSFDKQILFDNDLCRIL